MTELIKITENNGAKAVSARELHQFLESKQELNLLKGDIVSIAKEYGFSRNTCENVMRHRCFHPSIVKALYDKAVANKKQLDGGIQSMISNLKNA